MTNRVDPHDTVEWAAMAVESAQSTTAESRRIVEASRATRAASRQLRNSVVTWRQAQDWPAAGAQPVPDRRSRGGSARLRGAVRPT